MPSKKGKGGKGKKVKAAKPRKFNLDLFGILTLTRVYGEPFEGFITGGGKEKGKGAKKKAPPAKKGKGKKGKGNQEAAPKLKTFPIVPEDLAKDARKLRMRVNFKPEPDVIVPMTSIGHKEKTTRPQKPFEEGGSISDVMCGNRYPIPPRPQPHGGVYGDLKCLMCKSTGGLMTSPYDKLHKKLRKMLNTEFDKAKFIIEWLTERIGNSMKKYEDHLSDMFEELSPALDALDESEWDDHFEVRALVDKWREMKKKLDLLRAELKQFRKNRQEEIDKAVAEKMKEFEEVERQMLAIEQKVKEAMDSLKDWQENAEANIAGPEAEILATIELLQKIRESILNERDTLRQLLGWEMRVATEDTVAVMEQVIREDLDVILSWMHPAWFRIFLENRKMQEERARLRMENHLLELEVEALGRQVGQMENNQKEIEGTRTYFITPPNLNERVDKFFRHYNDFATVQLGDYPNTKLLHE